MPAAAVLCPLDVGLIWWDSFLSKSTAVKSTSHLVVLAMWFT